MITSKRLDGHFARFLLTSITGVVAFLVATGIGWGQPITITTGDLPAEFFLVESPDEQQPEPIFELVIQDARWHHEGFVALIDPITPEHPQTAISDIIVFANVNNMATVFFASDPIDFDLLDNLVPQTFHPVFQIQAFERENHPTVVELDLDRGGLPIRAGLFSDITSVNGRPGDSIRLGPIPEPATFTLFATGAAGLFGYRWLRRKRAA